MRGLWLERGQLLLRDDLPIPEPAAGEALVQVLLAGICRTDIELLRGYHGFCGIPGHEFVGRVADGPTGLLGRRVVGEINVVCGHCRCCTTGLKSHCQQRQVLGILDRHGAFAEYLTLPAANLHPVPEAVSSEDAVFTEPLAAALQVTQQVPVGPGDRVLVVGDGKLGQLVAQILALRGCSLLILGRRRRKLALLAELGFDTCRGEAPEQGRWDVAVECTGNSHGFAVSLQALRPRGTLVLKSTYAGRLDRDISSVVVNEITVIGSRCGPFAPALRLLAEGRVQVRQLIDRRFPLSEGLQAMTAAQADGALKVLLGIARPPGRGSAGALQC